MINRLISKKIIAFLGIISLSLGILVIPGLGFSKNPGEPLNRTVFIHYPNGSVQIDEEWENGHRSRVLSEERHFPGNGSKSTSSSQCPNPNTCPDYKYSGIHWPSMPVVYVIDPTNKDGLSASNIATAVNSVSGASSYGFAAWHAADNNFSVVVSSTNYTVTGDPTTSMDGVNSVLFRDISSQYPNALAVTFVWYYRFTKQIVETDTVFNDAYVWSYTDPAAVPQTCAYNNYCNTGLSSFDVGDIVTHEEGHWLMLNDLYTSRDSELTMYGYGAAGEMKKISLGLGDKLGIQKIY